MDASTYLRRKKESMIQYIHKPAFVDAGTRTEFLGRTAGSAHYAGQTAQPAIPTCMTSKPAFAGATPVKVVAPGCCITDTQSITLPCCEMIYEPPHNTTACKVEPYVGTRIQHNAAVDFHTCRCK
jgi:hypothetical protein